MIKVTVHSFDASAKDYGPATSIHAAADLGAAMKLFSESGKTGMPYQYVVLDGDSGEPLVTYYADSDSLADDLPDA